MKKFYTLVTTQKDADGYKITLDGRPVKTPLKADLVTPHEPLANAIMREWMRQGDDIIPHTMPLTQTLSTCIDRVGKERDVITATTLNYLNTDLLCYRSAEEPVEMGQAQRKTWDPYLRWFTTRFDAALKTTHGLSALSHDDAAHQAVAEYVTALDDEHFTALQLITATSGSLVLALAALHGQADAHDIFTAMRVEEGIKADIYNEDFYGTDPAQEKKDQAIKADLAATLEYLNHLQA